MHNKPLPNQSVIGNTIADHSQKTTASFPAVRYFQIHFEFLQEQLQQTLLALESLQLQMQYLEQRLPVKTNGFGIHPDVTTPDMTASSKDHLSLSPLATTRQPRRR